MTTQLERQIIVNNSSWVTVYFTWVWGCSAGISDDGNVSIRKVINSTHVGNVEVFTTANIVYQDPLWPLYGYNDPLLIDAQYGLCNSTRCDPSNWREEGKIMDAYITFFAQINQKYVVEFTGTVTTGFPDAFWGITNFAVTGHQCQREFDSRITATPTPTTPNPWIDDLVYDSIDGNGWSLPNLVLWNGANNGSKYHGM